MIGTASRLPERIGRRVSNSPVDAVASASPESARTLPGHEPASPAPGSEFVLRLRSLSNSGTRVPSTPVSALATPLAYSTAHSPCQVGALAIVRNNCQRRQSNEACEQLQRDLGITSLYVAHDPIEAITHADRLIVMNGGVAEQIGTPLDGCA